MKNRRILRVFLIVVLSTLFLTTCIIVIINLTVADRDEAQMSKTGGKDINTVAVGDETQISNICGNDTNTVHFEVFLGSNGMDYVCRYNNENGPDVLLQIFYFNPDSKQSGPPEGFSKNTYFEKIPIPLALFAESLGSGRPSFGGVFANSIGKLYGTDYMGMALLFSQDAEKICMIYITPNKEEEFFISPDYLIYPCNLKSVKDSGSYATVKFLGGSINKSLSIDVKRNDRTITPNTLKLEKDILLRFENIKKSDDVVEWVVTDNVGKIIDKGALGFPVRGAVPDLVVYTVDIAE